MHRWQQLLLLKCSWLFRRMLSRVSWLHWSRCLLLPCTCGFYWPEVLGVSALAWDLRRREPLCAFWRRFSLNAPTQGQLSLWIYSKFNVSLPLGFPCDRGRVRLNQILHDTKRERSSLPNWDIDLQEHEFQGDCAEHRTSLNHHVAKRGLHPRHGQR